jgi:hypothetical protein
MATLIKAAQDAVGTHTLRGSQLHLNKDRYENII